MLIFRGSAPDAVCDQVNGRRVDDATSVVSRWERFGDCEAVLYVWWRVMRPSSMVRCSVRVMVKRLPVAFRRCVLVPISTASGPSISAESIDTRPSAGRQCSANVRKWSATSATGGAGTDPRDCRVLLDRPVHSPGDLGRVEVRDVVGSPGRLLAQGTPGRRLASSAEAARALREAAGFRTESPAGFARHGSLLRMSSTRASSGRPTST